MFVNVDARPGSGRGLSESLASFRPLHWPRPQLAHLRRPDGGRGCLFAVADGK